MNNGHHKLIANAEIQGAGAEIRPEVQGGLSSSTVCERPNVRERQLPTAKQLLDDLIIIENFVPGDQCRVLTDTHRRWSKKDAGDNGLPIQRLVDTEPIAVELAKSIVTRIITLIDAYFHETVWCDLSLLTAITGTFRHTLHADNARISCPLHGRNAEELIKVGCECDDIEVQPNHTSWRRYTGLLYLDDNHEGGNIIFGEGPNVFGKLYREEIIARAGLLVLSPSNEFYHHRTTVVTRGTRYSLNNWFTPDPARACELFFNSSRESARCD